MNQNFMIFWVIGIKNYEFLKIYIFRKKKGFTYKSVFFEFIEYYFK